MNDQPHQIEMKIQALEEKMSLELNKKEEINSYIYDIRTKIARHNEKLELYSEEIRYYEELQKNMNNNNNALTLESEILLKTKEREDNLDDENCEDDIKIHNVMNEVLKEINDYKSVPKKKEEKKEETLIKFYTVCVIFLEFDSDDINTKKYQTFRVSSHSTIDELQEICQIFWDIRITDNPHFHFTNEETVMRLSPDKKQESIEKFLKEINNTKKTLFVLSFNEKLRIDDIIEKKQDLKIGKVEKNLSEAIKSLEVEKFLRKFVGLKTQMNEKLRSFKENERSENTSNNPIKKPNNKLILLKAVYVLFFFLFFIFTLTNLFSMKTNEKSFYMQKSFEKKFKSSDNVSSSGDIKNIITNMLSPLFYEREDSLLKDNTNILINSIRLAFYKTSKKECKLLTKRICYYERYNTATAESDKSSNYIINAKYKYDKRLFPDQNINKVEDLYTIMDIKGNNIIQNDRNYDKLLKYLDILFKIGMKGDVKRNTNFLGRFGKYRGQSNLDLYISSPFINFKVIELVMEILISSNNDLDIGSVRGITIDFVLFNPSSRFYFEISNIIEISPYGGILSPILTIRPFLLNIYTEKDGKQRIFLDIVRIVLIIIMMFFSVFNLVREIKENGGNEIKSISIKTLLFDPKIIINLCILIIYSLNVSLKVNVLENQIPQVVNIGDYPFLSQNELSNIADAYEFSILLETIIILLSFCEILIIVYYSNRIKIFVNYIALSFTKFRLFFLIIILMIIGHSIFAHNLWGENYDEYKNFEFSFIYSILFSIGHFQNKIFENDDIFWNVLYTLIFFLVIIYFSHSAISGLFLEMYRINAIEKGHSYDQRLLNLKDDNVDKKRKKKKVNVSASNI